MMLCINTNYLSSQVHRETERSEKKKKKEIMLKCKYNQPWAGDTLVEQFFTLDRDQDSHGLPFPKGTFVLLPSASFCFLLPPPASSFLLHPLLPVSSCFLLFLLLLPASSSSSCSFLLPHSLDSTNSWQLPISTDLDKKQPVTQCVLKNRRCD